MMGCRMLAACEGYKQRAGAPSRHHSLDAMLAEGGRDAPVQPVGLIGTQHGPGITLPRLCTVNSLYTTPTQQYCTETRPRCCTREHTTTTLSLDSLHC